MHTFSYASRLSAACAVLGLFAGASALHADTIYSNLGPGDTWAGGASTLLGDSPTGDYTLTVAARFTPAAAYDVDSIEAVLSGFDAAGDNVRFIIHQNTGSNLPGAAIGSVDQLVDAQTPALVSVDFSGAGVQLAAGQTYWLSILHLDATGDNGEAGSWVYSDESGYAYLYSHVGNWIYSSSGTTGAYRVSGTLVPEPASLALLGLGGLVLTARRKA